MSDVKDYSSDLQKLFVQFMLSDPELYSRVRSIVKPSYFDRSVRKVVDLLVEHSEEYSTILLLKLSKHKQDKRLKK